MDKHGSITKITRQLKSGKPSIRYRFRMGSKGKPVFFKSRSEATQHQLQVSKAIQAKGHDALQVLDRTVLNHVTASLEILKAQGLTSDHLIAACQSYTAAISTTALTVTIGEAVEQAMQTPRYKSLSSSAHRNYKSHWLRLVKAIGADKPLGSISVFEIEEFIAAQTPKAQAAYYTNLHILFGKFFVKQLRHMSSNLLDSCVPPERVKTTRRTPYTYTELLTLLEHVEPFSELDLFLHLHFQLGMRASETINLESSMINMERELIYLPHSVSKTKTDRNVMLTPALLEYLKASNIPASGRVFGDTIYRHLVEAFRDVCKAAKVERRGMTGRASFISHSFEGLFEQDMNRLQAHVGHSQGSEITLRFYLNAVNPADTKPYFKLPLRRVDEQLWSDLVSPHDE